MLLVVTVTASLVDCHFYELVAISACILDNYIHEMCDMFFYLLPSLPITI